MITELMPEESPQVDAESRHKVLIVDDDLTHLQILQHGLERQGFEVVASSRGANLPELVVDQRPQAIVLDICLPDANGLDLCRQISDGPQTSHIPIVILSGLSTENVVRQARSSGCRFFLSKPFDPNAMLLVIKQSIAEDLG